MRAGEVMRTRCSVLNKVLDLPELGDTDALEVHDRAARLDEVAGDGRADGQAVALELFVLDDERLELAFGRSDLIQLGEVELAELLDVDRPAVLWKARRKRAGQLRG